MVRIRHSVWLICVLLLGCANQPRSVVNVKSSRAIENADITSTDPCAMRLHDISGLLLLYYAQHHELPKQLSDLKTVPGAEAVPEFVCPVSHQPYVYSKAGIVAPHNNGIVIIYDHFAVHDHLRWAITILPPQQNEALVTKVIALPDSFFTSIAQ